MMCAVELRPIKMQIEFTIVVRQPHNLLALNELFSTPPMSNQVLDCADSESVFFTDLHQLGQTRHRPVIVQNFAKDAGGFEAGHGGEVNCRFGVTCPPEDAAILGPQRKDMARLNQIV